VSVVAAAGRLLRRARRGPAPEPPALAPPGEAERLLRRLDFRVIKPLDGLRQGDHRNRAYGSGLDLAELREYQPGDDVRALDWNVTARLGTAYVRRYHEERDITAWLVLDLSPSTDFGSAEQTKRERLIDVAGTLARLLTSRGDRVGALVYTGVARRATRGPIASLVPAGGGRQHVLRLLRHVLGAAHQASAPGASATPRAEEPPPGTDLAGLLEHTFRTATQRSLIILLSDFLDTAELAGLVRGEPPWPAPGTDGVGYRPGDRRGPVGGVPRWPVPEARRYRPVPWTRALATLAQRHEVVAVWIRDPREEALPDTGVVTFEDAESGEQLVVDTSQPSLRAAYARLATERAQALAALCARHGVALWPVSTDEPLVSALVRFLERRRQAVAGAERLLARRG
jgi:uncharacterized protein (DUF58 family)